MENAQIMLEIQKELSSVVKSMQQLTQSVGNIVAAVEKLSPTETELPKAKAKRAPVRKKVVVSNAVEEKIKSASATETVYGLIKNAAQGMNAADLMNATGFNQRKIHNITFRLKKQGRIKAVERGLYKAV